MTEETTPPAETPATETPTKPRPFTITLAEPIARESGANVTAITLRKPKAGELRGLTLANLVNSDAGSLITLLPRICEPFITDTEAANLSVEDFAEIGGTIVGFFMSATQKAMIEKMTAEAIGQGPSIN